jgi:predicted ATPase
MITKVRFQNFKALKDAELKLGAFNVIVGPNGSGKSSVLQTLKALAEPNSMNWGFATTVGMQPQTLSINVALEVGNRAENIKLGFHPQVGWGVMRELGPQRSLQPLSHAGNEGQEISAILQRIKIFSFETASLGQPVNAQQINELQRDGKNLVGALTNLRDKDEESYNRLREEFQRWIPEYDALVFNNETNGQRYLNLRQKISRGTIPASQASEGTLLALALLTIVHQPMPPILIGLEEPDGSLHPRLLRELRDALYRLAFPSDFGIKRAPVQVVVTTHSPFFLDLFKEHPEQVIIAEKKSDGTATFKNLSDDKELRELIGDAPLGEVWYSGVLGGVPIPA